MAALKALKDITKSFEEELTCSLCFEVFTDPKTLPCLHSYCIRCIAQWYQTSRNPINYKINCPLCKTTIVVPGGDPSKLRSSFYLDSLLQLLHAMKTKANQPELSNCSNCEQPEILVAFCAQCNGLICEACFNAHKSQKIFKRIDVHQPIMLNQFKEENVNSFIKNQMLCKVHQKKKLEYYCQEGTCRLSICQKCATLDHQNHQMQSLEDAAQDSRKLIAGAMNRVHQRKENDGQELKQSKENLVRIQREIDEAAGNVDETVKMICNLAKEHGEAMKNELTQTLQELTTANNEEQTAIKTRLKDSDEFVQHCQALLERDVAYEEIESKEMILERAKMLSEAPSVLSTQPIQRDVKMRYSVTEKVMQSLRDIGCIVKNVIDPARSTIESVKKVRPGFINECKIITRNRKGEVCPTRIESIDVRIKDVEGNEVEKKVSEEETGKYRVSFKPHNTGPHEIQVNIGGEKIKNSPQNVDILEVKELFKPVKTFGGEGSGRGELKYPQSIAVSDGEIAIADDVNHRIQIFSLDGNYLREIGSKGTGEGQLYRPLGVVFHEETIIVRDGEDDKGRLQEYDLNGTYVRTIYRPEQECFNLRRMCVNDDNNIAVCCWGKQELCIKPSIKIFSKQGHLVHEFDMPDNNEQPRFIIHNNGKYFVSCYPNYVRVFDETGVFLYKFGEKGQRDGQFSSVCGLAVYGPDMILVSDDHNQRVQLFTQQGQFIRSFGSRGSGVDQMNCPVDVVVAADGRVFVLECSGNRVSVFS